MWFSRSFCPSKPCCNRTHTAILSRRAARLNLSSLSSIRLEDILAGQTCAPISLSDFEAYLAFHEHSLENLQFVVWFQSYRKRFFALPLREQSASPGSASADFNFALPSPARTASRVKRSARLHHVHRLSPIPSSGVPLCESFQNPPTPGSPRTPSVTCGSTYSNADSAPLVFLSRTCSAEIPTVRSPLPFHIECMRIVATFLRPGAPKELMLDASLRDAVIRDLTWNTHPDVFQPIYEAMFEVLESQSLPNFLAASTAIINRPMQIAWYRVAIFFIFVSLVLGIAPIVALPPSVGLTAQRASRIPSVPFMALGIMTAFAAWRGFCSRIWSRGHTQLRSWELQEMDGESAAHWERVLRDDIVMRDSTSTIDTAVGTREKFDSLVDTLKSDNEETGIDISAFLISEGRLFTRKSQSDSDGSRTRYNSESTGDDNDSRRGSGGSVGCPALPDVPELDVEAALAATDASTEDSHASFPPTPAPPHSTRILRSLRTPSTRSRAGSLARLDPLSPLPSNALPRASPPTSPPAMATGADLWGWEAYTALPVPRASTRHRRKASTSSLGMRALEGGFKAPPVFGPERVVLDPRIKTVHRRVLRDIIFLGLVIMVVYGAIILSVPSARR